MKSVLTDLAEAQVEVDYLPAGCNVDTCDQVSVRIVDYKLFPLFIPIAMMPVPTSVTTVQRESLGLN
jgi:hypothetical protein